MSFVIPLRIKPDGTWNLEQITETTTVSTSSPYKIDLKERPDDGTIISGPTISGLSRVNTYPPQIGQFFVNYKLCEVYFHVSKSGQSVSITYYGKGSPIRAEQINSIYDTLIDHILNHPSGSGSGDSVVVNVYTLVQNDINNKFIYLDSTPKSRIQVCVIVPGSTIQIIDIDYTIDLNDYRKLYWGGYDLENHLEIGDRLHVMYVKN
jgi:hypothetical protein